MKRISMLCALVLLFCMTSPLWAQGVMIMHWPPDHRRIPPQVRPPDFRAQALTVKSIQFETSIDNQVARTRVVQVFSNDRPYVLEGTYFFPLPDEAAIADFVIYEGERKIRGEVLEKERARQIYNSIVREIRDPGLLEYAGKNLFQATIFPVPANGEKKIELEYTQILKADSGLVRYTYPLGTGGRSNPAPIRSVSGHVRLKSPVAIKTIYSPTHSLATKREGDLAATVSFENTDWKSSSDFQLFYSLSDKEFGLSLLAYRQPGEDGYAMLLISPKTGLRSSDVSKKDIVFVLDVSGSMNDRGKIEKAREALKFGIRTLNEGDRFNVISFSTEDNAFEPGLVTATRDNLERAVRFVEKLGAAGGTNIYDALGSALNKFTATERPQYLVFLTDGLPTVGETKLERILERARELNKSRVRIFTFGVGYDVNTFLLDQLASGNNGAPDYVAPEEDLEVKVSSFFEKVNYPVLSDIALQVDGMKLTEVYPRQIPDIFKGTQLSILARYSASGQHSVSLTGKYLNESRTFTYAGQQFPKDSGNADFLPRLWASRKVGYLLDQIRLHGESTEVKDEVVRLAKKYGFVTPYTSYLAADDRDFVRRGAPPWDRPIPMGGTIGTAGGAPGGFAGGVAGAPPAARTEAMAIDAKDLGAQSGAGAVNTSQALRQMKTATTVASGSSRTQTIGNKTFILQEEVWVDSEFDAASKLPVIKLKYGSDEYFDLIGKLPVLGKFFALGENVTLVFDGRIYEVRK